MRSIRIWTPESDFDSKTVYCIGQKIIHYYKYDKVEVVESSKQAYNDAVKKGENGLQKMVDIYLKRNELVIFLIDYDGVQSTAQRQKQPNSMINKIKAVVNQSQGKAKLIYFQQELEAWLLVDCLGICCYYTNNSKTRNHKKWITFCKKHQKGKTDLISEAQPGGKGVKEYLIHFSQEIIKKINPKLQAKDIKQKQYEEKKSPEIAQHIHIDQNTITRNDSLKEFADCLKKIQEIAN